MPNFRPILAVTAMAAAAVIGLNGVAVATTGQSMILGHFNYEDQPTRIITTGVGPAARFTVQAGQMPFSVNTTVEVPNLNADLVDGLSSSSLLNKAYTYSLPTVTASSSATVNFPGLPAGRYLASYAITTQSSDGATSMDCAFHSSGGGYQIANRGSFIGSLAAISGSGILDTTAATYTFQCFSGGGNFAWLNDQTNYSSITFLRVDSVSSVAGTGSAGVAHAATN